VKLDDVDASLQASITLFKCGVSSWWLVSREARLLADVGVYELRDCVWWMCGKHENPPNELPAGVAGTGLIRFADCHS
jgi:hypothetical protein